MTLSAKPPTKSFLNMKSIILFFTGALLTMSLFSCHEEEKKEVSKIRPVNNDTSLIIGDPFNIGIDNMLIFPIGTNYTPTITESDKSEHLINAKRITLSFVSSTDKGLLNDRLASSEFINPNENAFNIRNILFYELKTNKSYAVLKDTAHILSFALHKEFPKPVILYRIVKKDFNQDSIYNSADPVMLFVSDLYGKNLVQLTPGDEKFIDYFFYPETNVILVKTIIDSNHDKIFSESDETNFRSVNIKEPSAAQEIFTKSLKDSLRF
jgi:hypothetical protein